MVEDKEIREININMSFYIDTEKTNVNVNGLDGKQILEYQFDKDLLINKPVYCVISNNSINIISEKSLNQYKYVFRLGYIQWFGNNISCIGLICCKTPKNPTIDKHRIDSMMKTSFKYVMADVFHLQNILNTNIKDVEYIKIRPYTKTTILTTNSGQVLLNVYYDENEWIRNKIGYYVFNRDKKDGVLKEHIVKYRGLKHNGILFYDEIANIGEYIR